MVQMSFTLPAAARQEGRGRRAPARRARWASTRRCSCTRRRWVPTSPSSSSTAARRTSSTSTTSTSSSASTPCCRAKDANLTIKKQLRRKLVVVGACIGTDAHTVGIDAILNIKGFAGEKGLEYYREIKVVNLGAQVLVPELVARARAEKADAVLVSQVVTQKDAHIHNTTQMSAAFREAYPAGQVPILIAGGPRFEDGSETGARRRPDLRPRHDARRGRQLPGPRDRPPEGEEAMTDGVTQPTPSSEPEPLSATGPRPRPRRPPPRRR